MPALTELKFSLVGILEDAELCPDLKFTCDDADLCLCCVSQVQGCD